MQEILGQTVPLRIRWPWNRTGGQIQGVMMPFRGDVRMPPQSDLTRDEDKILCKEGKGEILGACDCCRAAIFRAFRV